MYNEYIKEVIGCDDLHELNIEELNRIYRSLLLKYYTGDVIVMHVKSKDSLRKIHDNNDILRIDYSVQSSHKLFYEGFMEAYNNIIKANGLEAYFDKNSEDKVKYIGKKYHRLETGNAYDTVKDICFNKDKKDGYYSTYDIIIEFKDHRHMYIIYEDLDIKNEVVKISNEVIQSFIDKMVLDKYMTQKESILA